MRARQWLPALLLGAGLLVLPTLADTPKKQAETPDVNKITRLIEQLGSDDFAERKKATEALDALGEPALEALRKATASKDAETRKRATDLVNRIEKRVTIGRILTAKQVHLVFKDTPLAEAVEQVSKKTGYTIKLHDPEGKLKGKKITLDTGKTTFWNALGQFCEKAGLVDGNPNRINMAVPVRPGVPRLAPLIPPGPAPLPANPPAKKEEKKDADKKKDTAKAGNRPGVVVFTVQVGPGGGAAIRPGAPAVPAGPAVAWVNAQLGEIYLMPGKPAQKAVDATTSIRVRPADPKAAPLPLLPDKGHLVVVLEVSPEPKVRWQRLISVKIDKAVDNNDETLTAVDAQPAAANPLALPGGVAVAGPVGMAWGPWNPTGLSHYAPVKLKKGDKETTSLKELKGTISAQVLDRAEQMLVVDKLMKAAGKSVKGKKAGELKIDKVDTAKDGTVTIEFELEMPADVVPETQVDIPIPAGAFPNVRPIPPLKVPALPAPLPVKKEAPAAKGGAPPAKAEADEKPAPVKGLQPAGGVGGGLAPQVGARPMTTMRMRYALNGLTLQDDKGKPLYASITFNWRKGGLALPGGAVTQKRHYVATYRPLKDMPAEPSKLVFTGRHTVPVIVPFTLKDVAVK